LQQALVRFESYLASYGTRDKEHDETCANGLSNAPAQE
jgi:hypothetical protein